MANFIFEKYSTKLEYYAYRISRETITSTITHSMLYKGVSLNTETGKWYASPPTFVTIQPGSYLTGYTWAGDARITRRYNGTADQLEVIYDGVRSRYVKDTFIENVIGTDAEYPLDGRAGGYWYIR
ncbi:MAG TPA: hypothetical protein VFC79_02165, partial [Tissierellaceae bacterium]|nr:hypothetical protein [Tissierellaceae bacterium]